MVQMLNDNAIWVNSLRLDFETWGLSTERLIEIHGRDASQLQNCVARILEQGFATARGAYLREPPANYRAFSRILASLLRAGELVNACKLIRVNVRRKDFSLFRFLGAGFTAIFLLIRRLVSG